MLLQQGAASLSLTEVGIAVLVIVILALVVALLVVLYPEAEPLMYYLPDVVLAVLGLGVLSYVLHRERRRR